MKNGKAPGSLDISVELVKHGPVTVLSEIFNKCLLEGQEIPVDWNSVLSTRKETKKYVRITGG